MLEVKNRVLEEAKVSFSMAPRTRNGHEIGSKFLLENLKLLWVGLPVMQVRVPYGIWAQMDSAEIVSDIVVDLHCEHVGEVCNECQYLGLG